MPNPSVEVTKGATVEIPIHSGQNLTGYTIASQLRDQDGEGALIYTFTTSLATNTTEPKLISYQVPNGVIVLGLTDTQSTQLVAGKADYAFDIKLTAPGGKVSYFPLISLKVKRRATV